MRLLVFQYSGFGCLTALAAFLSLTSPSAVGAQDSPTRFGVGGNITTLRFNGPQSFNPGAEGDVNFGRHFALDAALTLRPSTPVSRGVEVSLGGKAGLRTELQILSEDNYKQGKNRTLHVIESRKTAGESAAFIIDLPLLATVGYVG